MRIDIMNTQLLSSTHGPPESIRFGDIEYRPTKLRPEFEALALELQAGVDRARGLYPWPPEFADIGILQRQTLAVCAEAGELAEAVAKNHGDERIRAEAIDVLVTAARVVFRR